MEKLARKLKWLAGIIMMLALMCWPEDMLRGVQQAMRLWYYSVAPALFPFMALLPLLTCRESMAAWQRMLGGVMEKCFRLPGPAAPGMIIGMLAGSPAGASAIVRVAARSDMTVGQLHRLSGAVCGLSPAFLSAGIGAAMLKSPSDGFLLLRSQVAAQLILLLLLRRAWESERQPVPPMEGEAENRPVSAAVSGVLNVCGYMALFSGAAQVCGRLLGAIPGGALLCILDLPSGAGLVSTLYIERTLRLTLLSAMSGFSGICIIAQNLAILRPFGVKTGAFLAMRALSAGISAAITALQMWLKLEIPITEAHNSYAVALLVAVFLAVPGIFCFKKSFS